MIAKPRNGVLIWMPISVYVVNINISSIYFYYFFFFRAKKYCGMCHKRIVKLRKKLPDCTCFGSTAGINFGILLFLKLLLSKIRYVISTSFYWIFIRIIDFNYFYFILFIIIFIFHFIFHFVFCILYLKMTYSR